jgi:hypothetical protein
VLSEATRRVLRAALRSPRTNRLACPADVLADLDAGAYFGALGGADGQAAAGTDSREAWPMLLQVGKPSNIPPTSLLWPLLAPCMYALAVPGLSQNFIYGLPDLAQALAEQPEENEAALRALGLARAHLREVLLDAKLLPCAAFRQLPGCACSGTAGAGAPNELPAFVALDGSAFDNLEVGLPDLAFT